MGSKIETKRKGGLEMEINDGWKERNESLSEQGCEHTTAHDYINGDPIYIEYLSYRKKGLEWENQISDLNLDPSYIEYCNNNLDDDLAIVEREWNNQDFDWDTINNVKNL